jgi:hypothetical protein
MVIKVFDQVVAILGNQTSTKISIASKALQMHSPLLCPGGQQAVVFFVVFFAILIFCVLFFMS